MILGAVENYECKKVIVAGLYSSLGMNYFRYFFRGTFEFDDLIHNTFEAVIGHQIIENIGFRTKIKRKQLRVFFIMFFFDH